MPGPGIFLFSVDLEEFEPLHPRPDFRRTPLPELTRQFLGLLQEYQMKTTFFIVGAIARTYPALISEIFDAGHELACHTDLHRTLDAFTPEDFQKDLEHNLLAIVSAVPKASVVGFRAPVLSLNKATSWAYRILTELGFKYSSSVLPAASPLFGWPEFGKDPRRVDGIWEFPVSVGSGWMKNFPIAAGTYFRCLPRFFLEREFFRKRAEGVPIFGYFHPYDIDTQQEYLLHQGMAKTPHLNPLLYFGRRNLIYRLKYLLQNGFVFERYDNYLGRVNK